MLIDGELVEAASGATYANVNPATEEVIGQVADGGAGRHGARDRRGAAGVRRDATGRPTASSASACLRQLQEALAKDARDAPPADRRRGRCADHAHLRGPAGQLHRRHAVGHRLHRPRSSGSTTSRCTSSSACASARRVVREPIGVVGAITPWNFPFMLNLSKIVPALAAGQHGDPEARARHAVERDATSASSSPSTPTSRRACFNVVTSGDPATVGEVLTGDPRVDMISFTGSTAIGKRIMARGAETLKRVFLELGGKSANIILDDADLAAQCGSGAMVCMHGGQGCAITTRMLLPRSRYDEGVELVKAAFEGWRYGDPTDAGEHAGPADQRAPARACARLHREGQGRRRPAASSAAAGRAQFERATTSSRRCSSTSTPTRRSRRRRSSARCSSVIPYDDDDDAVRIANNSSYGLSGAVNGKDLDRGVRHRPRIRTGTVSVNGGQWFGPDSPFGGYKESGLGREHGVAGLRGVPRDQDDRPAGAAVDRAARPGPRTLPRHVDADPVAPRPERLEPGEPLHRVGRRRPHRAGRGRGGARRRDARSSRCAARRRAHVAAEAGDPYRRARRSGRATGPGSRCAGPGG